ncbi:uncharacterized protein LOC106644919 [Copidosoma floridanum]|uniref:uncharacterized protein LOC106644919 n=1 Tax=Copidosoma floridanum TaxID=29053 RepID=UPI0006C962C4|nr:uncharacterized protein LOC106644919 [Copidosoma floridanum]
MLSKIAKVNKDTLQCSVKEKYVKFYYCHHQSALNLLELIVAVNLGYESVVDRLLNANNVVEAIQSGSQDINRVLTVAIKKKDYSILKMLLEAGLRADRRFTIDPPNYFAITCPEINLKIICLLREFQDNANVDNAIIWALYYSVSKSYYDQFIYLLFFFYAVDLHLGKLHPDLMPAKGLFELNESFSKIFSYCNSVIKRLKSNNEGSISIFDMITMPLDLYVRLLDYEIHWDACKNLHASLEKITKPKCYDYVTKTRIELAIEKRQLLDNAEISLNKALEDILMSINYVSLPSEVVRNIFMHFNTRELRKLVEG